MCSFGIPNGGTGGVNDSSQGKELTANLAFTSRRYRLRQKGYNRLHPDVIVIGSLKRDEREGETKAILPCEHAQSGKSGMARRESEQMAPSGCIGVCKQRTIWRLDWVPAESDYSNNISSIRWMLGAFALQHMFECTVSVNAVAV